MQWTEFQDTAERLVRGSTEGDRRSAISRSYYGVFHCFREFLLGNGLDVGRGGPSHFNLYSGLLNCGVPAAPSLGRRLDSLRSHRIRADYALGQRIDQLMALHSVQEGRALMTDL